MEEKKLYPLSHPQKRIWYIEQIYPNTSLYNIGGTVRIKGKLDLNLLHRAILLFIEQNEGVRLRISLENGEPRQYVSFMSKNNSISFIDFSEKDEPENEFKSWAEREAHTPFKIFNNALYKFTIFIINKNDMGYFLKYHHIICDGFSISLMTAQVIENYLKIKSGTDIFTEHNPTYLEYLETEAEYLKSARFIRNQNYWNDKFSELPEPLHKKSSDNIEGKRKTYIISEGLTRAIKGFISNRKISLNTFYTGILLIYFSKITQQNDVVIGIPVLNRFGKAERNIIGMYTSTMPFRIKINGNDTIKEFLKRVNSEFRSCYLNQKYPYNFLAQDLELRKHGYTTLFNIFVNYYNTRHLTEIEGIRIENEDFYSGNQIYSIQLVIREWLDTTNITLSLDYKVKDYTDEEIERMNNSFNIIIRKLLSNPDISIDDIELLSEEDRKRVIYDFNSTTVEYPHDKTIHELFEEQALKTPDKIAISFNEESVTYQELNKKANQVSTYLKKTIIEESEPIIAIAGYHSIEIIIGILGILKSGAAFLPIAPELPEERVQYILKEAGVKVILTNNENRFENYSEYAIVDLADKVIYQQKTESFHYDSNSGNLAYIIYTSGSTGTPKGVMVEHKSLVNYIWWAEKKYIKDENEVFAFYSSISFDLTITSIFTPLINGTQIRIYNPYEEKNDFVLYRIIKDNKATILKLTPSHLTLMKDRDNSDLHIKRFIVGGEDFKVNLAQEIYRSFNGNIELYNEYGPTEATVGCMIYKYDARTDTRISVPIGKPSDNVQIYILDDKLKPVPNRAVGELYISGDCLASGYVKKEELTQERFISNPYVHSGRMYKTGDLARFLDNRIIEYIGRNDDQIKIRGHRCELGEIEKQLLSIKRIEEAVVLNRKHQNGSEFLCAYLVTSEKIEEEHIRNHVSQFLPEYMIPSHYIFLDSFPLTAHGKKDKKLLPEIEIQSETENESISPKNEKERLLLSTIRELIGMHYIGMNDNFYHLGGDSIKAIQISSKLNDKGVYIKVRDILSNPIICEMANYISTDDQTFHISQESCKGEIEFTPIISWFFSHKVKNPNYYNQSVLLELKNDIEVKKIEEILTLLIQHHDTLRLNYNPKNQTLFYNEKYLHEFCKIPVYDISGYFDEDKEIRIREHSEETKREFNIEKTLLFRSCIFIADRNTRLWLLTAHHLIIDAVSWRILLEDINTLMQQYDSSANLKLPSKTHSYQYWANYLKNLEFRGLESEIAYWNVINKTNFQFPCVPNNNQTIPNNIQLYYKISAELTNILLTKANIPYRTKANELLVIALVFAIQEYTNDNNIVLELEHHGRYDQFEDIALSRSVGWFTSTYPVLMSLNGTDMHENIKSLKEQLRKVPGKGIGYGLLRYKYKKIHLENTSGIRFNYLGNFDVINKYSCFQISNIDHGSDRDPCNHPTSFLEIDAMVTKGELNITFSFDRNVCEEERTKNFSQMFKGKIQSIIDFCLQKEESEFTPSDFDGVNLNQDELDNLFI